MLGSTAYAGPVVAIMVTCWSGPGPLSATTGWAFSTSRVWDPVQDQYGGLVMIYGTLATSLIALVIAVRSVLALPLFLTGAVARLAQAPLGHGG